MVSFLLVTDAREDDNTWVHVRRALRQAGASVEYACGARDGETLAASEPFDAVVVDEELGSAPPAALCRFVAGLAAPRPVSIVLGGASCGESARVSHGADAVVAWSGGVAKVADDLLAAVANARPSGSAPGSAIGSSPSPRAVPALLDELVSVAEWQDGQDFAIASRPATDPKAPLVAEIHAQGEAGLAALLGALSASDPLRRGQIAHVLVAFADDRRAREALLRLLDDLEPRVRGEAEAAFSAQYRAFVKSRPTEGVREVRERGLVVHRSPAVRLEAVRLVAEARADGAFELVGWALRDPALASELFAVLVELDPGRAFGEIMPYVDAGSVHAFDAVRRRSDPRLTDWAVARVRERTSWLVPALLLLQRHPRVDAEALAAVLAVTEEPETAECVEALEVLCAVAAAPTPLDESARGHLVTTLWQRLRSPAWRRTETTTPLAGTRRDKSLRRALEVLLAVGDDHAMLAALPELLSLPGAEVLWPLSEAIVRNPEVARGVLLQMAQEATPERRPRHLELGKLLTGRSFPNPLAEGAGGTRVLEVTTIDRLTDAAGMPVGNGSWKLYLEAPADWLAQPALPARLEAVVTALYADMSARGDGTYHVMRLESRALSAAEQEGRPWAQPGETLYVLGADGVARVASDAERAAPRRTLGT